MIDNNQDSLDLDPKPNYELTPIDKQAIELLIDPTNKNGHILYTLQLRHELGSHKTSEERNLTFLKQMTIITAALRSLDDEEFSFTREYRVLMNLFAPDAYYPLSITNLELNSVFLDIARIKSINSAVYRGKYNLEAGGKNTPML